MEAAESPARSPDVSAPSRLFVTGAGGFIGNYLVTSLTEAGHAVRGLQHAGGYTAAAPPAWQAGVRGELKGDLLRPGSYRTALEGCDAVLHLAALAGRAKPRSFFAVNVAGTRALLEACRQAAVPRFLFVSSIAARFPSGLRYPYARSKAAAEEIVSGAGLRFCTVRPTIVLGTESAPLRALTSLASLPVVPMIGGGTARIQPIHVDDLVDLLCRIVAEDRFYGETLELGGPEVMPIGDLLRAIHRRRRGRNPRTLPLPARPLIGALSALERVARPLMPVGVGQLASFVYDGAIEPNSLHEEARQTMMDLDRMLEASGIG